MTPRPRRRFWLKLAAGLLFAVVAYGGAYLGTSRPLIGNWRESQVDYVVHSPHFVLPGDAISSDTLETFFWPAYCIDYWIRGEYWLDWRYKHSRLFRE